MTPTHAESRDGVKPGSPARVSVSRLALHAAMDQEGSDQPVRRSDSSGIMRGNALSKPEDDTTGPAKPSALLQNLAAIAARAPGGHKRYQDARYGNSSGAASEGKRLTSWRCACGWTGAAKELKVTAGGLSCPSCGASGGLTSA